MNEYRVTKEEYENWLSTNTHPTIDDFVNWSRQQQDIKEVILRSIARVMTNNDNYICWNYIIESTQFPADVILDLIFITSGWFSFDFWTDDVRDFIVEECARCAMDNDYTMITSLMEIAEGEKQMENEFFVNYVKKYVTKAYQKELAIWENEFLEISRNFEKARGLVNRLKKLYIDCVEGQDADEKFRDTQSQFYRYLDRAKNKIKVMQKKPIDYLMPVSKIKIQDAIYWKSLVDMQVDVPRIIEECCIAKGDYNDGNEEYEYSDGDTDEY